MQMPAHPAQIWGHNPWQNIGNYFETSGRILVLVLVALTLSKREHPRAWGFSVSRALRPAFS